MRRPIVGVVLVAVAAVVWLVLDRTVLQDRRLKRDAAIAQCESDVRADTCRRANSSAQLHDLNVMQTVVSEDAQALLQHEARPESSAVAVWQVNGKASVSGLVPFGSGLESENRFVCAALVFDDGSVDTFARQINP